MRGQGGPQGSRFPLESGEPALPIALLGLRKGTLIVGWAGCQELIENASQLMSGGSESLGSPEPSAPAAIEVPEHRVTVGQAMSGSAPGVGSPAFDRAGFGRQDPAAPEASVRAKPKPGGEVRGGGKGRPLGAQCGEEGKERSGRQARPLGKVYGEAAVEGSPQIGVGAADLIVLGLAVCGGGRG